MIVACCATCLFRGKEAGKDGFHRCTKFIVNSKQCFANGYPSWEDGADPVASVAGKLDESKIRTIERALKSALYSHPDGDKLRSEALDLVGSLRTAPVAGGVDLTRADVYRAYQSASDAYFEEHRFERTDGGLGPLGTRMRDAGLDAVFATLQPKPVVNVSKEDAWGAFEDAESKYLASRSGQYDVAMKIKASRHGVNAVVALLQSKGGR